MFTADNIVKQDFMSVHLFDNCHGSLDHTKIKRNHMLLLDQGFKFRFGQLSELRVSKYTVVYHHFGLNKNTEGYRGFYIFTYS
jgi:hypothetical protein